MSFVSALVTLSIHGKSTLAVLAVFGMLIAATDMTSVIVTLSIQGEVILTVGAFISLICGLSAYALEQTSCVLGWRTWWRAFEHIIAWVLWVLWLGVFLLCALYAHINTLQRPDLPPPACLDHSLEIQAVATLTSNFRGLPDVWPRLGASSEAYVAQRLHYFAVKTDLTSRYLRLRDVEVPDWIGAVRGDGRAVKSAQDEVEESIKAVRALSAVACRAAGQDVESAALSLASACEQVEGELGLGKWFGAYRRPANVAQKLRGDDIGRAAARLKESRLMFDEMQSHTQHPEGCMDSAIQRAIAEWEHAKHGSSSGSHVARARALDVLDSARKQWKCHK
ncbi:hypothetical protein LTR53_001009 [Teratosphaeriaceae sp. CCFEE 6253]|nr:hypothetical protein LTR53_001009 [Teratosphaeriaceae sp. CCFEE 6253]